MDALSKRLKNARCSLHLSQAYVADYMGVKRTAIVEIESGKRKVSAQELLKFSELYCISCDALLNKNTNSDMHDILIHGFSNLDIQDQQEILSLIKFKQMLKHKEANQLG